VIAVWYHAMRGLRFVAGLLIVFLFLIPALLVWLVPVRRWHNALMELLGRAWGRVMLGLLGARLSVDLRGADLSRPAVCVANHTGYVDILLLIAVTPGCFISRSSVAWWPVIGQLTALAGTLYVDRSKRFNVGPLVRKMRQRLRSGRNVIFFPEATSSDGRSMLPFRPPLFAAAAGEDGEVFPVRPIVIRYTRLGGEPIDDSNRDDLFWHGEMTLLGHLWHLLGRGIDAKLEFLPDRTINGHRREFAEELRDEMVEVYERLGRASSEA
jgi:lyso-ornithine lipid O-acyltransferase